MVSMRRANVPVSVAVLSALLSVPWAARGESGADLESVVVTATRTPQDSRDLPVSIDRINSQTIRNGQLQVNLSETLLTVPGVSAQSRQNYAQDLQLSVRGFGARSSFGVRGVRLYSDGIPGTMPDGQGQFSQFDLSSADHIEVLRGPFSALYGNSSGGVIAIFTEDAKPGFLFGGDAEYGSFNTQRYAAKTTGDEGLVNYVVDASHFQTDGYRVHSAAERNLFNAKASGNLSDASKLTLVANAVQTPFIQDPLGLTREQLAADPRQAGVSAIQYNTRKSLAQEQLGLVYDNHLSAADDVVASMYSGHRATTQFQAIPQATQQAAPLYPGGVIDLDRVYWGADLHVADQRTVAGTPLLLVAGLNYDDLAEARKGYLNFIGAQLGVQGALRRDEANHVYDFDQYLQAQWDPAERWRLVAGVRNSLVEVTSHGHLALLDSADSEVRYSAVNPVAGVTYRASSAVNFYGSYGKGFETPTLNDLAYRSVDGSLPGLNFGLKPARSDNYEAGIKAGNEKARIDLAAFYIRTTDELSVLQNSGGRTVDQNIGETTRRGLELGLDTAWSDGFSARLAYTYIKAVVAQSYFTCVAAPCNPLSNPTGPPPANFVPVAAGAFLPAVARNTLYLAVSWSFAPLGFSTTFEALNRSKIYADDRNSAEAAGYWVANLRAGFQQDTKHWHFSEFARLDNLANRAYVGSVIVNETNSRFFEPAPGRTAYLMLNAALRN
ncbi:MAG TPA: TonB-dependent receptor [Steroidobacteraceae bacterium]|jgi:iron complex outermembrane receptor protein|nr:TonB-dependent receptor [Steroidobacteraceae bacterium]